MESVEGVVVELVEGEVLDDDDVALDGVFADDGVELDGVFEDGVDAVVWDGVSDVMAWLVEPVDSLLLVLECAELVVLELVGVFGSPFPPTLACAEQPVLSTAIVPTSPRTAHICSLFMPRTDAALEPRT